MPGLTRRQVLAASAAVAVALLPGGVRLVSRASAGSTGREALARQLAARVEGLGADVTALTMLGTHYLRQRPDARAGDLLVGVPPSGVLPAQLVAMDDPGLRAALGQRVTDDLRAGRVVPLGGWILASCEARLCAILALTASGPGRG